MWLLMWYVDMDVDMTIDMAVDMDVDDNPYFYGLVSSGPNIFGLLII
jgi:hypothetical protein